MFQEHGATDDLQIDKVCLAVKRAFSALRLEIASPMIIARWERTSLSVRCTSLRLSYPDAVGFCIETASTSLANVVVLETDDWNKITESVLGRRWQQGICFFNLCLPWKGDSIQMVGNLPLFSCDGGVNRIGSNETGFVHFQFSASSLSCSSLLLLDAVRSEKATLNILASRYTILLAHDRSSVLWKEREFLKLSRFVFSGC